MSTRDDFSFVVEETFTLPARAYILALGTVEHGVVRLGDPIELRSPAGESFPGLVEHIEFHSHPGKNTLGITGPAADHLTRGARISSTAPRSR